MASVILPWENDAPCYGRVFVKGKGGVQSRMDGALVMATPKAGIEIRTLPVGSKVVLTLNGVNWSWLVVQQGKPSSMYDDSCNGTWLLLEKIYETRNWHSSNDNRYAMSTIHNYLNNTFLDLFDTDIKNVIKQVKIPYGAGRATSVVYSGSSGLSTKVFLASDYELGWTNSTNISFLPDGAKWDYFLSGDSESAMARRIAYQSGTANSWWTRSPQADSAGNSWYVSRSFIPGNNCISANCAGSLGIRPAIILPSDFLLSPTPNADGTWSPLEP